MSEISFIQHIRQNSPFSVGCPSCRAQPGFRCRLLNGNELLKCHKTRLASHRASKSGAMASESGLGLGAVGAGA